MTILLSLILLANVLLIAIVFVALRAAGRVANRVWEYLTPVEEGKTSPFGQTVDAISMVFARSITAQIKTTLMSGTANLARGQRALEGDLVEDTASMESPLVGALMASFPHLRKSLRRNPALVQYLGGALSKLTGVGSGGHAPGNGGVESPKFKL